VGAVDVSPHGTKIATTASAWSPSTRTGKRALRPFEHEGVLVTAAKFSLNGCLLAIAAWHDSIHVRRSEWPPPRRRPNPSQFETQPSPRLCEIANNSALFRDGNDHGLDVSIGKTRSKWRIHSSNDPQSIVVASNRRGTFIAASANSSVSCYATTHKQIGSVIRHADDIWTIAIP
jgi:hypothetical protein